jgi:hybrid cluster-associated redox disulfide protein
MITPEMSITEIIQTYPQTIPVFQQYGLGCIGCFAASGETLADGLTVHGIEIGEVVAALNQAAGLS